MTTEVIILSLVILAIWVWALILFIPTLGKAFLVFKGTVQKFVEEYEEYEGELTLKKKECNVY